MKNRKIFKSSTIPKSELQYAFFAGAMAALDRSGLTYSSYIADELLEEDFETWNSLSIKLKEFKKEYV